jgi:hypothetical protein
MTSAGKCDQIFYGEMRSDRSLILFIDMDGKQRLRISNAPDNTP